MNTQQKRNLKTACYYKGASFGNFTEFFSLINQSGKINMANLEDKPWRKKLLIQDFEDLIATANSSKIRKALANFNQDGGPENQYRKIVEHAGRLLRFDNLPGLYIVDTLPSPFNSKEWDSMSVDKKDEEVFKIPQGVYFKEDVLTHCYFEFLIAHEVVHWAISEHSINYLPYVPWLEEGICDVLGALILIESLCLPAQAVTNLFIYNRVLKSKDNLWRSYWDSCKQVIWLLWMEGFEAIINLVRLGRDAIVKISLPQKCEEIAPSVPKTITTQTISAILQANSVFGMPIDDYLTLLATIDNKTAKNSLTTTDISKLLQMPEDLVLDCLKSLGRSGYLVPRSGDVYQVNESMPINLKYIL